MTRTGDGWYDEWVGKRSSESLLDRPQSLRAAESKALDVANRCNDAHPDKSQVANHVCSEQEAECCICCDEKPLITLGCGHCVCAECLHQQLHVNARCALCRKIITTASPSVLEHADTASRVVRLTRPSTDEYFGMDLLMKPGDTGAPVVVVTAVNSDCARKAGLRPGDIILSMNECLPCYDHERVAQMLSIQEQVTLRVMTPRSRSCPSKQRRRLRKKAHSPWQSFRLLFLV